MKQFFLFALLLSSFLAQAQTKSVNRIEGDTIRIQARSGNTFVDVRGNLTVTQLPTGSSTDSVLVVANGTLKRIVRSAFSDFVSKTIRDTITASKVFTQDVYMSNIQPRIGGGAVIITSPYLVGPTIAQNTPITFSANAAGNVNYTQLRNNPIDYIASPVRQRTFYLPSSATDDTLSTKSDISGLATTSSVNTALSLKQNTLTLTTTGSGAATLNSSTGALNIPVSSGGITTGTYAQRIAIASPSVGQQFYQTDIFSGLYEYNGRMWVRNKTGVINDCDFLNANDLAMNGLTTGTSGTNASLSYTATNGTAQNTTGIVAPNTGTTTTGFARIMYSVLQTGGFTSYGINQYGTYIRSYRVLFPNLSDGTNSYNAICGSDLGGISTGFNFVYLSSNANWQIQYSNNVGTFTTTNTGVAVIANTWYELSIVIYSNNPTTYNSWNVEYYINNSLVGSYASLMAIEGVLGTSPIYAGIFKNGGTTTRSMHIDFMKFYQLK